MSWVSSRAVTMMIGTSDTLRIDRHTSNRSEEHTSELQSRQYLVCRLLLEKKKNTSSNITSKSISRHLTKQSTNIRSRQLIRFTTRSIVPVSPLVTPRTIIIRYLHLFVAPT